MSLNRRVLLRWGAAVAAIGIVPRPALAAADATIRLSWDNLIPPAEPLKNPLEDLPEDQVDAVQDIAEWLSYPQESMGLVLDAMRDEAKKRAMASKAALEQKGVDASALFARYGEWQKEIERRGRLTATQYDGQRVSLGGYLLPLDFEADGGREFLLVPYVGACIHTPPPPPNQIVFVKMDKPHPLSGLFDAALVTDTMKVEAVSKDLTLVDGASSVDVSYVLEAPTIGPYEDQTDGQ